MKQNFIKILTFWVFLFAFIFVLPKFYLTFGAATNINTDYTSSASQIASEYPLPCDNPSLCQEKTTECWNSEAVGSSTCGTACEVHPDGQTWTKYSFTRDPNLDCRQVNPTTCIAVFHSDGAKTCSTGDKDNAVYSDPAISGTGDLSILRAGFCSCAVGGAYKTCCSNGQPVPANSFADDPYDPLEGGCGNNTLVYCGGAGQPACGAAACGGPSPTPCSGTPLSCQSSQVRCPTGYTPTQLSNGNYACLNSSGQVDCSTTPYCPSACPTTGGYTGETCTCGSGNVPTTCASDPNKCNTCSLKYCLNYAPNLCCYYNEPTCFKNDVANCKNFGPCGSDKCIPGSTRTVCSAPNVCPAP